MDQLAIAPIPWRHAGSSVARVWIWETQHFQATITGDSNSFLWELGDLIRPYDGLPRYLTDGRAATFDAAENEVREAVGKCYPPEYGYRRFAGSLATTFTLATGIRFDFGALEGQRSTVTVRTSEGPRRYTGTLRTNHFEVTLATDQELLRIQPAHIERVVGETGQDSAKADGLASGGRMYPGTVAPGCTGRAGFLPNTVDHVGKPVCPVHESATRSQLSGRT